MTRNSVFSTTLPTYTHFRENSHTWCTGWETLSLVQAWWSTQSTSRGVSSTTVVRWVMYWRCKCTVSGWNGLHTRESMNARGPVSSARGAAPSPSTGGLEHAFRTAHSRLATPGTRPRGHYLIRVSIRLVFSKFLIHIVLLICCPPSRFPAK